MQSRLKLIPEQFSNAWVQTGIPDRPGVPGEPTGPRDPCKTKVTRRSNVSSYFNIGKSEKRLDIVLQDSQMKLYDVKQEYEQLHKPASHGVLGTYNVFGKAQNKW